MTFFANPSYPFTTRFFRWSLPRIPSHKPRIFQLFRDYSRVDDKTAKSYLVYFSPVKNPLDPKDGGVFFGPKVEVEDLSPGVVGYTPPDRDHIELDKTFLDEIDPLLRIDHKNNELQARAELYLESTVLHELVHYISRKDGGVAAARTDTESIKQERKAREFERDAYGAYVDPLLSTVTVRSLNLTQFMPGTALRSAS